MEIIKFIQIILSYYCIKSVNDFLIVNNYIFATSRSLRRTIKSESAMKKSQNVLIISA